MGTISITYIAVLNVTEEEEVFVEHYDDESHEEKTADIPPPEMPQPDLPQPADTQEDNTNEQVSAYQSPTGM